MNFHQLSDRSINHIVNGSTLSGYPFLDNDTYDKDIITDIQEGCDSFRFIHYILDFVKFVQLPEMKEAGLIGFQVDYLSWGSGSGSSLKKTLIPLYKHDICEEEKQKIEIFFSKNRKKFPGSQTSRQSLTYLFHIFDKRNSNETHIFNGDNVQNFLRQVFGIRLYAAMEKKLILNKFIQEEFLMTLKKQRKEFNLHQKRAINALFCYINRIEFL